jgi:hypothetical protein
MKYSTLSVAIFFSACGAAAAVAKNDSPATFKVALWGDLVS